VSTVLGLRGACSVSLDYFKRNILKTH